MLVKKKIKISSFCLNPHYTHSNLPHRRTCLRVCCSSKTMRKHVFIPLFGDFIRFSLYLFIPYSVGKRFDSVTFPHL